MKPNRVLDFPPDLLQSHPRERHRHRVLLDFFNKPDDFFRRGQFFVFVSAGEFVRHRLRRRADAVSRKTSHVVAVETRPHLPQIIALVLDYADGDLRSDQFHTLAILCENG